jgi:hypothetical protein
MFEEIRNRPSIKFLTQAFVEADFELYLVGGSVRDLLSGHEIDDFDFTTNAHPNEIEKILDQFTIWDAGKEYGTIAAMVRGDKVEITTFRTDKYHTDDRHPVVRWGESVTEDLERRDFTINAIAVKLDTFGDLEIIDPFGGQNDLRAKILRTPGNPLTSMSDDPLRVLRALRFASVRGLWIDFTLWEAMKAVLPLSTISQERKTAELEKIIKGGGVRALTEACLVGTFEMGQELFGPFNENALMALCDLSNDASSDTIFSALTVFNCKAVEDVSTCFRTLRLPASLMQHCRGVWSVMQGGNVWRTVRDNPDAVLDDALIIREIQGITDDPDQVSEGNLFGTADERAELRKPLPVDGNDMIELGLVGQEIGAALKAIEDEFLFDTSLTRQQALDMFREDVVYTG